MNKAKVKGDLRAILDLLAEWREENHAGYVTMNISSDGGGYAYTFDNAGSDIDTGIVQFEPWKNETPAAGTDGESGEHIKYQSPLL